MLKMKLFCTVAVAVLSSGLLARGQSAQAGAGPGKSPTSQFVVGPSTVLMPQGVFLLIRKGREIGAIRFTSIEQGGTVGTGRATYDSYFQSDGSGSFRSPNFRKQTGETNLKPLKGVGRLSFQSGQDKLQIGDWSFATAYPGRVNMWPYRGSQKDYGYEFAPTSAREVGEIDVSDKRLRWFRFDPNARVTLPVSDLPK
jgi:hypothetical protein